MAPRSPLFASMAAEGTAEGPEAEGPSGGPEAEGPAEGTAEEQGPEAEGRGAEAEPAKATGEEPTTAEKPLRARIAAKWEKIIRWGMIEEYGIRLPDRQNPLADRVLIIDSCDYSSSDDF